MIPTSLGVCSGIKEKICEDLICKMNAKNCIGKGEIPADGTKCAENKVRKTHLLNFLQNIQ